MSLGHMLKEMLEKLGEAVTVSASDIKQIRKDFTPEDLETAKFFLDDFKALAQKYSLLVKAANRMPIVDFFTDVMVNSAESIREAMSSHNNRFMCNALFKKVAADTGNTIYFHEFCGIADEMRKLYNTIHEEQGMNTINPAPIEDEIQL